MSIKMWFEELPEQCPPSDAINPNGNVYYRLVETFPPACKDFWSHRKAWPEKVFKVDECRAKSVSIFDHVDECRKLTKLPLHKDKYIVQLALISSDGVLKQTGRKSHHSWWRSPDFDPRKSAIIDSQECSQ